MLVEFLRYNDDNVFRTSFCTKTTAYAEVFIHCSQTITDRDGIFRADSCTVAMSKTSVLAGAVVAVASAVGSAVAVGSMVGSAVSAGWVGDSAVGVASAAGSTVAAEPMVASGASAGASDAGEAMRVGNTMAKTATRAMAATSPIPIQIFLLRMRSLPFRI